MEASRAGTVTAQLGFGNAGVKGIDDDTDCIYGDRRHIPADQEPA
jgi:hypothetical protein